MFRDVMSKQGTGEMNVPCQYRREGHGVYRVAKEVWDVARSGISQ